MCWHPRSHLWLPCLLQLALVLCLQIEAAFSQPNAGVCEHMVSWAQRVTSRPHSPAVGTGSSLHQPGNHAATVTEQTAQGGGQKETPASQEQGQAIQDTSASKGELIPEE